jgi:GAF domain-containing protein/HAMP domain-containing protein
MKAKGLSSKGRSIRLMLLIPLLAIATGTVLVLAIIAVNSIQSMGRSAQISSSEALLAQAQEYLIQLNNSSARENDLALKKITDEAEQLAAYTASIFNNPEALASETYFPASSRLYSGPGGQLMNSKDDISSLLVPNFRQLDEDVIRDIELSAYLDFMFEAAAASFTNVDAIYFATPRDVTRYFPNIELGAVVPPDFAASQRPWFVGSTPEANLERAAWWTPPYVDATGLGVITTAAMPVYGKGDAFIGVIGLDVTLTEMVEGIEATRVLKSGYSFMIDQSGQAIAMPDQGYIDILGGLPEAEEINLGLDSSITGFSPIIRKMMAGGRGMEIVTVAGNDLFVAYAPLESAGWSLASVVQSKDVLQSVMLLQQEMDQTTRSLLLNLVLPVSAGVLLLVIVVVLLMTNIIVNPIHRLVTAAEQLQRGEWDVDLPQTNYKEMNTLAAAFSSMVSKIQQMVSELESRVIERTKDLERRSNQIQVAAEVARDATASGNLDVLLSRAVYLINERFGFYHAGIFLTDEKGEYAVLRSATGQAGKAMLEEDHKLQIGEVGIVGHAVATGQPRIALDVGADPAHFQNPLLPHTRSEMAVPLKVGQNVIGVLDVQSDQPQAFDQEDVMVLQIVSDQLAVAIENARLLEETQESLQQLQVLYGQYSEKAWEHLEKSSQVIGFSYDRTGLKKMIKTDPVEADQSESSPRPPVLIPLQVRGQRIGQLEVWPQREDWGDDKLELLNAVSERVSQALESARLFEETQSRVLREQTLNRLIARFAHTLDFDALLQTAVKEMGQLPNVTEVAIHVGTPQPTIHGDDGDSQSDRLEIRGL